MTNKLPWKFEDYGNGLTVVDADENDVAVVSPRNDQMHEYAESEYESANLIIRAVNNHDKLVEALRTLADEFASRLDGIYDATNEEIAALDCARTILASLES